MTNLTGEKIEDKKKQEDSSTEDADVHEEGLGVEALIKLHDLDGLVEDRINEEVAGGVAVVEVDGQTDGTSGECVSWDEGVGHCGLLLALDILHVVDGGEVLEVEGEVHGVAERGLHAVHHHLLVALVGEPNQELRDLTGWKLCKRC